MATSVGIARVCDKDVPMTAAHILADFALLEQTLGRFRRPNDNAQVGLEFEVETYLRHRGVTYGLPATGINSRVVQALEASGHRNLTTELRSGQFEVQHETVPLAGDPYALLLADAHATMRRLRAALSAHGADICLIGGLPCFRPEDGDPANFTADKPRYQWLNEAIWGGRPPEHYQLTDLDGNEHTITMSNIGPESSNTSVQMHVEPLDGDFVGTFNRGLAVAAYALLLTQNTPFINGIPFGGDMRAWLFAKSCRGRALPNDGYIASELDAFRAATDFERFPPFLRWESLSGDRPRVADGEPGTPALDLQGNSIWWSDLRGIVNGKPRVELRALPAGPTVATSLSGSFFWAGLIMNTGLRYLPADLPYEYALENLMQACRSPLSLDTEVWWADPGGQPRRVNFCDLAGQTLIPAAYTGLTRFGHVRPGDAGQALVGVTRAAETGVNGAVWQIAYARAAEQVLGLTRFQALQRLHRAYVTYSDHGLGNLEPADWPTDVRR